MPPFRLTTLAGKSLALPHASQTPTVLNFWSVWCGACIAELPELLTFQQSHPGIPVLAIAVSDRPKEVTQLLKQRHLERLHVAILSSLPEIFGDGVPVTAVAGPSGELAFFHQGGSTNLPAILEKDLVALR